MGTQGYRYETPQQRESRWQHLDEQGKRCDGNGRTCLQSAVHEYALLKLDADGKPQGEPEIRRSCSRRNHILAYTESASWRVLTMRDLPGRMTRSMPGNR